MFDVVSATAIHRSRRRKPATARTVFHAEEPRAVETTYRLRFILAIPAGKDMKDRTPGRAWPRKFPQSPYFLNPVSAHRMSSWPRPTNLPYRRTSGPPPKKPMKYATVDPRGDPIVAIAMTIPR